jgi:hypothetical protein
MSTTSIVAVLVAGISAIAAIVSAWVAAHTVRSERLVAAEQVAMRFREPLLQAAFNLQARIYNIVALRFFQRLAHSTSPPHEREYAFENTLYLLGQYFCWVEILRRESQFLDPRSNTRNREVAQRLERVRDVFAASDGQAETVFRLFRGEQRAIGEVMFDPSSSSAAGLPRWECIGYAAFAEKVASEPMARWFSRLRSDLGVLIAESGRTARLIEIQHALLDLIRSLDPKAERVSATMLMPLNKSSGASISGATTSKYPATTG